MTVAGCEVLAICNQFTMSLDTSVDAYIDSAIVPITSKARVGDQL